MKHTKILLILFLFLTYTVSAKKADMVIYSYNRPLQLYALLESVERYVTGIEKIQVIYRASDERYQASYKVVQEKFLFAHFIKQGSNPKADFKPLTLRAVFDSPSEYIVFAVDDDVVTDAIDLESGSAALEKTNAHGFHYKLGLHLTHCYSHYGAPQKLPAYKKIDETLNLYTWCFEAGELDWRYPFSLDMVLYRKSDLAMYLTQLEYFGPNSLEGSLACQWRAVLHRYGLFYAHSQLLNIPLNLVQQEWKNPHMNLYSPQQLLEKFEAGLKMDIQPLFKYTNTAVHTAYEPTFIER